jgi:hypothetical protein
MRASADYFRLRDAGAPTYIGSMRLDEPAIVITPTRVTITGRGLFSESAREGNLSITIPRVPEGAPPPAATLRHFTAGGAPGPSYVCAFESPNLRTVYLEEAREAAVTPFFSSYDTGALPSGGSARSLSPGAAFGEAGVEAVRAREPAVIDASPAGVDAAWSDAELHAAMELSFSRWADSPQWAMWLLHAVTHEDPELYGLMFDRQGPQRQGCAVFYGDRRPTNPEITRSLLHVCVHELGHVFNLPHCWQRSLDRPPFPSRPGAKSWMNYPNRYPGGQRAYWSQFAFEFDDTEVIHLRHAFRENVIMGGSPFGSSSAPPAERWDAEQQDAGLRLKLLAPTALARGFPVTVGLELSARARSGRVAPRVLGPRPRTVDIAIRDPAGNEFAFVPLLQHCRQERLVSLRPGGPPLRDYAFIHYGKYGFAFHDPGLYRVRARYSADDGSLALSDELSIRVTAPASRVDREVAKLVVGNHPVGKLMSLMGSGARDLQDGNDALRTIIDRYPTHPMADIARVVLGADLARGFRSLAPDGSVALERSPDAKAAASLVGSVVEGGPVGRPRDARDTGLPAELRLRRHVAPAVRAFVNSRRNDVRNAMPALVPQVVSREATSPRPLPGE